MMSTMNSTQLKDEGNLLFTRKDFRGAILKYTDALSALEKENGVEIMNRVWSCMSRMNNVKQNEISISVAVDLSKTELTSLDSTNPPDWFGQANIDPKVWLAYCNLYKILLNRSKAYFISPNGEGFAYFDLYSISPLIRSKDVEYAFRVMWKTQNYKNIGFLSQHFFLNANLHAPSHFFQAKAAVEDPKNFALLDHIIVPNTTVFSSDELIKRYTDEEEVESQKKKKLEEQNAALKEYNLEIRSSSIHGVGLYATKNISDVTVPFSVSQNHKYTVRDDVCELCLEIPSTGSKDLISCPHCRQEKYCSSRCKTTAWSSYHQSICHPGCHAIAELRERSSLGMSGSSRINGLIVKFLAMAKQQKMCSVLQLPLFHQLALAKENLESKIMLGAISRGYTMAMRCLYGNIAEHQKTWSTLRLEEYFYMYSLLANNCVGQISPNEPAKYQNVLSGTCVHETFSYINHSCFPLAAIAGNGLTIYKAEKEKEIFISYIKSPSELTKKERGIKLFQYGFECRCILCQHQT